MTVGGPREAATREIGREEHRDERHPESEPASFHRTEERHSARYHDRGHIGESEEERPTSEALSKSRGRYHGGESLEGIVIYGRMDRVVLGSWRPPERVARLTGWLLLMISTATILTNAYYFQFLEPTISRKTLALPLVAVTGLWFLVWRFGLPRNRTELVELWSRARTPLALALLLSVAFSLRYAGAGSGLPQSYVPDEYDYVHSYLVMIKRGDMNPRWWHHPSFQPYVNVAAYLVAYYSQASSGRWPRIQDLQVEDALLWGRVAAGVIPGTLAVLAVFFLGKRMFGTAVGLIAAALLAVAPGLVEVSQYNKPDALLVLFCTLSVLTTLVYLERGGARLALAAGAVVGLAVAVKYNAAFVLLPFLIAVVFRHGLRVFQRTDLYLGLLGAIVGFTTACPYWYPDLPRFLDHVGAGLYNYGYLGLEGASGTDNWYTHASYTVRYGAGLWALLASLLGLAIGLYRIDRRITVFLAYPVLYYGFYGSQKIYFAGNLVPVYPFYAVLAAYGITESLSFASGLLHRRFGAFSPWLERATLAAVLALVLWFPFSMTRLWNHLATLPDTGTIANQWIEANIPPESSIGVERQTPVLDGERYRVHMESRVINQSVEHYREAGVQYLIVSSTVYERFGPEHRQTKAYQRLFETCRLVKEFAPEEGKTIGPTIRILEVPKA
jgi:4-amino-4-deoxy-L-arabinose transferase-like glycosyltransferase